MRIVVLGAGTVGTWIADILGQHRHSVTVIDIDPEHIKRINDELDVKVVVGSGSQSSVLFSAGVIGADMFLGVSGSDEVNIVAASMAKAMGVRRAVARVYAPVFRDLSTFDYQRHFNIDRLMSLEQLSAMALARGIRHGTALVMDNFALGDLEALDVEISSKADGLGTPLKDLDLPSGVRIGSIQRDGRLWIAGAQDTLEPGDHILIIGDEEAVRTVRDRFQRADGSGRGVVIAGAGETGYHLARALERDRFHVTVMEMSKQRCEEISVNLRHSTVLNVDAMRRTVLEEERVGSADYFIACTGDDENNIMAGVEARDIGAKSIFAVVGRPDYAAIVGKLGIDLAVSPRDVMAKHVLGMVNTGPIISRSALPNSKIEVYEIEVQPGSTATEHVLAKLQLPSGSLIAAVMRESFVRVPGADDRLQAGDTVVALFHQEAAPGALALFG